MSDASQHPGIEPERDDRDDPRVVVVTPGYHMASIDAKTGKPDLAFGKDGVVDLMEGLGIPLVPLASSGRRGVLSQTSAP